MAFVRGFEVKPHCAEGLKVQRWLRNKRFYLLSFPYLFMPIFFYMIRKIKGFTQYNNPPALNASYILDCTFIHERRTNIHFLVVFAAHVRVEIGNYC